MVKNNFRNNYRNTNTLCPLCEKHEDNQEHILKCETIMAQYPGEITGNIADIYSNDDTTLHNIATTLKKLIEIRNSLLNPDEENSRCTNITPTSKTISNSKTSNNNSNVNNNHIRDCRTLVRESSLSDTT